ncbi:MAG: GAF domain-containing protein, partial [Dehalococcoidia bacterium]
SPERAAEYLQAVIDSLDDELTVIDRDFRLVQVNTTVLRRYNRSRSEVIGRHCYELSHRRSEPCQPPLCECPVEAALASGKPERATHIHSYGREGAEESYSEVIASPLRDGRGEITEFVLLIRDVTEAKRLEQQIVEANQNLLALNAISSAVSQSLDLDTILNSALDKVLELVGGNTGGILLLDEESGTLCYRVYRGLSEGFVRGIAGLRVGEGIAGKVAQLGEPIYVDDISQDPRVTREVVIKEGLRAFASVPLQSKNKVLGVMNIASHTPRRFSPQNVQLLGSVANQIGVAIENAGLYKEVQHKEEIRGELLRRVISTQEEERKRIARGLHDETSQTLTSLAANLEAVIAALPVDADEAKAKLRAVQSLALKTLDEIHRVIYELRPALLDDLGLVAAVQWQCENCLEAVGIKVNFETAGVERRLPAQIETALFRIIQEATTNILRHAEAESASISLEFKESSVAVHIEDDGKGFDPHEAMSVRDRERGLGLLGMKERAELLGGFLSIQSQPGRGTRIDVEIEIDWRISDGQDKSAGSR